MPDLSTPTSVIDRLEEIDHELAIRQNLYEEAARAWYTMLGTVTKNKAIEFRKAEGNSTERREAANEIHGEDGSREQAEFEALRAVIKVLEARAMVGMAILKSQGRVS